MKTSYTMRERVEMYINHRMRLGYKLGSIKSSLLKFADYADKKGHTGPLTVNLAIEWAIASEKKSRSAWSRRLALIHRLAKYFQVIEPNTEIPPLNIYGSTHRRPSPYIYSQNEIHNLLVATQEIKPVNGLKPITFRYLLGLLSSTGLRVSEAIRLLKNDVDLLRGILTIRETKFRKSRYIPVHSTTLKALNTYVLMRDKFNRVQSNSSFFQNDNDRSLNIYEMDKDFRLLREKAGLKKCPRLYDFRHTFACKRLLTWYQEEKNLDAMMIYLSTYLGHARVIDTYWYITASPELMSIASKYFEKFVYQIEEK